MYSHKNKINLELSINYIIDQTSHLSSKNQMQINIECTIKILQKKIFVVCY
jgi:hypothetical protein